MTPLHYGRVWFSIYTYDVRCRGCFMPADIGGKA
jgi:hypothetical protein